MVRKRITVEPRIATQTKKLPRHCTFSGDVICELPYKLRYLRKLTLEKTWLKIWLTKLGLNLT